MKKNKWLRNIGHSLNWNMYIFAKTYDFTKMEMSTFSPKLPILEKLMFYAGFFRSSLLRFIFAQWQYRSQWGVSIAGEY